jgi:hypothetical protein
MEVSEMKREIPQRTLYCLECDACGVQSPRMYSMDDAIGRAKRDGWLIEERWNGQDYVQRHYCPLDWPRDGNGV